MFALGLFLYRYRWDDFVSVLGVRGEDTEVYTK